MKRLIPAAAALLCLGLAILLQWKAQEVAGQARGYQDQVTLLLQEPRDYQGAALELEAWQEDMDLTLWGEEEKQYFIGAKGHGAQALVIAFAGSTEPLFPGGAVLYDVDRGGCLMDEKAAQELFGSLEIIGESVSSGTESWTVRGVLPLQEGLVVLPAGAKTGEILLDRLTARLGGRQRQSGAELLTQGGWQGTFLRTDFYEDLSWVEELVPGKWADFDGWSSNLEKKRQEWSVLGNTEKYVPQLIQYRLCRSYHWYHGGSMLLLLVFLVCMYYLTIRPYL